MLQNALYLMGGSGAPGSKREVWESSDLTTASGGVVWTRVTVAGNKFTGRQEHSSAVLGGALYVLGGTDGTTVRNDAWKSTDKGRRWTKVGENAQALERTRHTSVVLDNAIYVIGGSIIKHPSKRCMEVHRQRCRRGYLCERAQKFLKTARD